MDRQTTYLIAIKYMLYVMPSSRPVAHSTSYTGKIRHIVSSRQKKFCFRRGVACCGAWDWQRGVSEKVRALRLTRPLNKNSQHLSLVYPARLQIFISWGRFSFFC